MLGRTADARLGDWTHERTALLRTLWSGGISAANIAREMGGITRCAVLGKAHRLGLPGRKGQAMPVSERIARSNAAKARWRKETRHQSKTYVELPPIPTVAPEFLGISFDDLARGQCRYTNSENSPYLFCGQPATHKSYCGYCYGLTHTPTPKPAGKPFLQHGWGAA